MVAANTPPRQAVYRKLGGGSPGNRRELWGERQFERGRGVVGGTLQAGFFRRRSGQCRLNLTPAPPGTEVLIFHLIFHLIFWSRGD